MVICILSYKCGSKSNAILDHRFSHSHLLETLHGIFLHVRDQASMRFVIDHMLSTLTEKGRTAELSSVMHTLEIVHCSYLSQHCERYQLLCPLVYAFIVVNIMSNV